jgi:thioredoxin 1
MSNASAVTGSNFEQEVLKSTVPVVVDFWAVWCNPCKMIAPTLDAVAADFAGRAKVLKVNVDEEQDIAQKYNIRSIPTLLFFKDGKVTDQIVGVQSKQVIADKLQKLA